VQESAIARVKARAEETNFQNNSALIHLILLGFSKEKIGRSWSEPNSEQQYQEAVKLTRHFLWRLSEYKFSVVY
jgi:hypothetical protein